MSVIFNIADHEPSDGLNMSNANAVDVLVALDLPHEELDGEEDGTVFLARVLVALCTERLDDGRPTITDGNHVYCGRGTGYITLRLIQLHDLAQEAARLGRIIYWS